MALQRKCKKCETPFNEVLGKDTMGPIDPIPECWKNNKQNGHCINCCNCYR